MINPLQEIRELIKYRELLRNLVTRDIKVRYRRSVLGFVWVILNPLLMMLILFMVFSSLFRLPTESYGSYLLSGIILWNFFSQSTSASVHSFLSNSNLIKKIYLPKAVFPIAIVISALINFFFTLGPLSIIMYLTSAYMGPNVYLLPLVILLVAIFSLGVALIVSTMTVFFHDTQYIYEVVLLAWMYLTPIFYPESIIPQKFLFIFRMNPFYYFLGAFRGALYMDIPNLFDKLLWCAIASLTVLISGWLFYDRFKDRMVYYL